MRSGATCEKLNGFLPWISNRIKGQPEVLAALDAHLGRSELGLTEPDYVLGGFLFVGPTGVGKTETTLVFAEYFFGPNSVARLNMAEFKEARSVLELRERLAKAKREGKRVYLIDEIEKAHWEVLDLFLGILDKGAQAAAPDGAPLDFTDCYFVMTSNLGAREAMRSRTRNYVSFSNTVIEYVRRYLRPELLGRLEGVGAIFVFRRLDEPEQRQVAAFQIDQVLKRMKAKGHRLHLSEEAFEYILRNGFSDDHGARPLLGAVRRNIEGAVSTRLRRTQSANGLLIVRQSDDGLQLSECETESDSAHEGG